MRRLFEGGVYSRAAFILPTGLHRFPPGLPRPRRSCELCPRPLALSLVRAIADLELELAQFSFSSAIRGHHVYLATHLRMRIATVHMNIIKCGYCSRAATITLSSCSVRRLFEGGVYSRKYGTWCLRDGSCLQLTNYVHAKLLYTYHNYLSDVRIHDPALTYIQLYQAPSSSHFSCIHFWWEEGVWGQG